MDSDNNDESCGEFRFLGCLEDEICCRVDTFNPRLVVLDWDLKWVQDRRERKLGGVVVI